jgi:enoyl-[acyl-carrier protein] reductase I
MNPISELLKGKTALVAGVATRKSIAWGIAQALHAHGATVAMTCLEQNTGRVERLARDFGSAPVIPCNVQSDGDITAAIRRVGEVFDGRLNILVHSIAVADLNDLGGEFIRVSRSGWNLALEVSAYSLVALAREARPLMIAAGGGSVMTLTFLGGQRVTPGYNIMGVAKAALDMTVRYLAYDLGPDNIRVNAISAGPIRTISSLAVEGLNEAIQTTEETSPLLRCVTQEDMGQTAVYLASDLSSAVTGQIVAVDSGVNILAPDARRHRRAKATEAEKCV